MKQGDLDYGFLSFLASQQFFVHTVIPTHNVASIERLLSIFV